MPIPLCFGAEVRIRSRLRQAERFRILPSLLPEETRRAAEKLFKRLEAEDAYLEPRRDGREGQSPYIYARSYFQNGAWKDFGVRSVYLLPEALKEAIPRQYLDGCRLAVSRFLEALGQHFGVSEDDLQAVDASLLISRLRPGETYPPLSYHRDIFESRVFTLTSPYSYCDYGAITLLNPSELNQPKPSQSEPAQGGDWQEGWTRLRERRWRKPGEVEVRLGPGETLLFDQQAYEHGRSEIVAPVRDSEDAAAEWVHRVLFVLLGTRKTRFQRWKERSDGK